MAAITAPMSNENIKDAILQLLRGVNREGMENLIQFLLKSDFFTAPASTKFHLACEGGLARHSLNVYYRLISIITSEKDMYGLDEATFQRYMESAPIIALLHDICKTGFYKPSTRNVKNEDTGKWEKVSCYVIDNQLPYGHGEKSVYMLSGFISLTREEALAIRWHMGGFDDAVRGGSFDLTAVYNNYPIAVMLNAADNMASYLDETTGA